MSDELLPCPFCGGEPYVHTPSFEGDDWQIDCANDCGAADEREYEQLGAIWRNGKTFEEAAARWNRRAPAYTSDGHTNNLERDGSAQSVGLTETPIDPSNSTKEKHIRPPVAGLAEATIPEGLLQTEVTCALCPVLPAVPYRETHVVFQGEDVVLLPPGWLGPTTYICESCADTAEGWGFIEAYENARTAIPTLQAERPREEGSD